MSHILVIRLGALGDVVQGFGPFAAIRARHRAAQIALLTTRPFAAFLARAPWFDRVVTDTRPAFWNPVGLARLRAKLRRFDFVYDLQTSSRSSWYFLLAGRPPWSGIAPGCSHPHANPGRDAMHTRERQIEQLRLAGVTEFPTPDLGWLAGDVSGFALPVPYALLAIGAAPHRADKRWPAGYYGALASRLARNGLTPVVIGSTAERPLAAIVMQSCPQAIDLTGRTSIADIGALAAHAALAVGNDTGPMHLAAAMGCRCIVLFSGASDPALTAPRGPDGAWPIILRAGRLADLPVASVAERVADTRA